jgi:hypothetical protein
MTKAVKDAVDFLITSYGDIRAQAVSYAQVLPKEQVQDALDKANVDSVDAVVLAILLNAYPTATVTYKSKKLDANSTQE